MFAVVAVEPMGDFIESFPSAIPLVAENVQNVRVARLLAILDPVAPEGVDGACGKIAQFHGGAERFEGAAVARGTLLSKPGSYRLAGLQIEGIAAPHDRLGGRRFGQATLWRWRQGGLDFAHLGGTAASLSAADRVLLGRPDVLILGVGGGAKVYNGAEAAAVVTALRPRRVIPVQYGGGASASCDQGGLEPFLGALPGTSVRRPGRSVSLTPPLGDSTVVEVLR